LLVMLMLMKLYQLVLVFAVLVDWVLLCAYLMDLLVLVESLLSCGVVSMAEDKMVLCVA